jgi:hypothetical protein
MKNQKSQTATEYLILLAVVIVVALVVVNTLGVFPGIGSSSNKKISDQKLANDIVGVTSYFIGDSYSIFNLKNNNYDTITVTEFRINQQANLTCNLSNTIPALPVVLNIGQSVTINCSVVNTTSYTLSDRKTPLIGILYIDSLGASRLAGNVLTYDAVSLSGGNGSSNQSGGSNLTGSISTNGLVAYYQFEGNYSDISGNGNNGNCTNCPVMNSSNGIIGNGSDFNANTNKVITVNNARTNFNMTNRNISISVWFYKKANTNGGIVSKGTSDASGNWDFLLNFDASGNLYWNTNSFTNPSLNQWHHVVFINNGTNSYGYLNGALLASSFAGSVISNNIDTLLIGNYHNNNLAMKGMIDELLIYNRTLNASEVVDLYHIGSQYSEKVLSMNFNSNGLNYLNLNYSNRSTGEQGIIIQDNSIYNNSGNSSGLAKQYWWNGNTYGASEINGSLQFDGVDDWVNTSLNINGSLNFTLSTWIKFSSVATTNSYIWLASSAGANANYLRFYTDGNLYFSTVDVTGTNYYTAGFNITNLSNTWIHAVGVRTDGNKTKLYVNGVLVSQSSGTQSGPIGHSGTIRLGNSANSFNGSIDDVIVWGRALNATEISTVYTEGLAGRTVYNTSDYSINNASRIIPTGSRVAYYNFNANDNGTDSWGNYNLTCNGGPPCPVYNATGGVFGSSAYYYSADARQSFKIPNSTLLNGSSGVTLAAWVKTSQYWSGGEGIIWMIDGTYFWGLRLVSPGYYSMSYGFYNVNTPIPDYTKWHFLVGTMNQSGANKIIKLYMDGQLIGNVTENTAAIRQAGNITIGESFQFGYIDEAMIFNRTLLDSEIQNLYDGQKLHYTLNELNGTSAFDTSSANSGTLTNYPTTAVTAPVWNATGGVNGTGAYVFDGTKVINGTITAITGPFTFSLWVKNNGGNSDNTAIFDVGTYSTTGFGLWMNAVNSTAWRINGQYNNYKTAMNISDGTLTHITVVYNGTNISMFKNGQLKSTDAYSTNPSSATTLSIGKRKDTGTYFNGIIDNVQIFNRALNATEVLALYNSP